MKIEQIVENPQFLTDIKDFFELTISTDEINRTITNKVAQNPLTTEEQNAGVLGLDLKLNTFIDRIEFIKHLKVLVENAKNQDFIIEGQEVVGVDWDISALRLYLSLTCIDIFYNATNHKEHFENVFNHISKVLNIELEKNLRIIENGIETKNKKGFAEYFYTIRNSYTHAGVRFHSDGTSIYPLSQKFVVGTARNKNVKELQIEKKFNLIDFILKVAIENAKRIFGW